MAYNFTVPARTDIGRQQKDVNVRIRDISIRLVDKSITVIIQKTDRNNFEIEELVFTLMDDRFIEIAGAAPSGASLYDAVKSAVWENLIAFHQREITFGGEPPLLPDGSVEQTPAWMEVA